MNRTATTLTELLLVLAILGILASLGAPSLRKGLDAIAVRSARETTFAIAVRARSLAISRGGADFVLDMPTRMASAIDAAGSAVEQVQLATYGVTIAADGQPNPQIVLHYDAHGIGRIASRTIRFRRGSSEAGLTFSSFGRVHRW